MIVALLLLLLAVIFVFIKRQYSFWDRYEIPNVESKFPFGNLESIVKKERSFGTAIYDIYKQTSEPFIGIYLFFRPAILVNDRELVKNILTTDFQYFHDRGTYCDAKNDPMSANLFSLPGEPWKTLRTKLTPAFTSGKLKGMFPTLKAVGEKLVKHMKPLAKEKSEIEIRDLAGRYVADCLASVAFGQEDVSTLDNPEHEFRMTARRLADNSKIIDVIRGTATFVCPNLIKFLRMKSLPAFMREFCINMVTKTIKERERNNIVRKDLIQYLIQLRNNVDSKGGDDEWKINASGKSIKSMSYEEIAAQVFIFYIAGNESSSSTVAYTLYELTQNDELMRRAQEDVEMTLDKHDGEFTYESVMEMKFIDLLVKETLRKYPGLPILNRECTKDYQIPGSKFTIEKGMSVIVSLLGIHRDEKFFPDPEKYDPDRFSEEKHAYDEDMYMPFGLGPRNCIAFRMGLLVSKVAIVMLLKNFNFEATMMKEIEFDHGSVVLMPKPGDCKFRVIEK